MGKRVCEICNNEVINETAKFCEICGSSLMSHRESKYEVIIREKSTGKDVERMDCDGAMCIYRQPSVRKDGEIMGVGMFRMSPFHQMMSLKAVDEAIRHNIEKAVKEVDPKMLDMVGKDILKDLFKDLDSHIIDMAFNPIKSDGSIDFQGLMDEIRRKGKES